MPASEVVFGYISQSVAVQGRIFSATIEINNAASATIKTHAANVGYNWVIKNTNSAQNLWTITGTAPTALINFLLVIEASNSDSSSTVTQSFQITTTSAGSLSDDQKFMAGIENLALWIDPSEATTLANQSGGSIGYIYDRYNGYGWNLSSSEQITRDVSSFGAAGITFSNIQYSSGFNTAISLDLTSVPDEAQAPGFSGISVADDNGYSTLFMVVGYDDGVIPVPEASFYAFDTLVYDENDETLCGAWGLTTTNPGISPLSIQFTQNEKTLSTKTYSRYLSENIVPVGGVALVCWRFGPNGCDIRVNALQTPLDYSTNNGTTIVKQLTAPISGFIAPTSIGLFGSPYGYTIGSFGEIVAIKGYASDAIVGKVENYLKAKWLVTQAPLPDISTTSNLFGYVGDQYVGEFIITNGNNHLTTANIIATSGSDWTITQVASEDYTKWTVSGTLPTISSTVTLSIQAQTDNVSIVEEFNIAALSSPPSPIIGSLSPFQAIVNDVFVGDIEIDNVDPNLDSTFSVQSTQGTGWTITESSDDPRKFVVSGTMPSTPQTFSITITAVNPYASQTTSTTKVLTLAAVASPIISEPAYKLDLTGTLQANLISNEKHTVTNTNGVTRQIIIPKLGPYYADSLVVKYKTIGNVTITANKDVDYQAVLELQDISSALGLELQTAVEILNPAISGSVYIDYQTLGGNFALNREKALETIANLIANPRKAQWSSIINAPTYYPPSDHTHAISEDFIGASTLNAKISSLITSVINYSEEVDLTTMSSHIATTGNPHGITKAQIDLGNVLNYPPATAAQAISSTNDTVYLTPATAALAGQAGISIASATVAGIAPLNLGTTPGDDINSTDVLTPQGLIQLLGQYNQNAILSAFVNGQRAIQASPTPLVFPLYWNNKKYTSLAAFIVAIQTYVNVYPIQYNQNLNTFHFPIEITPPSLVTYQSPQSTTLTSSNVNDDVDAPMGYYV